MIASETSRLQHLLRRAAFGCRAREWQGWVQLGHEAAVDRLINYDTTPQTVGELPVDPEGNLIAADDPSALRRYWLTRFCETSRPLEETMTLFWHGHFATADYKVQNANLEWRQMQLFRKHALGNFRELLGAVAIDPAMLIWLDGNNSKKSAPNENFSRELLELFTMGVDGGYTEQDVKAGARAFTGWSYDSDRSQTSYHPADCDAQNKVYLGKAGNWNMEQALNIVARHPSTARFLSKKLFEFFVFDHPPTEEVDRLAAIYHRSNGSIREMVRGVFESPHFYSPQALYAKVKGPVQYAVIIVKTLDLPSRWLQDMQNYTEGMGQQLLNPPNVKGWKQGDNWINSTTMTARLNFAGHAVDQLRYRGLARPVVSAAFAARDVDADKAFATPEGAVVAVWNWLLPDVPLPAQTQSHLVTYMKSGAPKDAKKDFYLDRSHGLIELVLSTPQYQLA